MIDRAIAPEIPKAGLLAAILCCLAFGMAGWETVSRMISSPEYSYEVLVVGDYPMPLPAEYGWGISQLETNDILVASLDLEAGPRSVSVTTDPELYRRIANWKLTDCIGQQLDAVRDGELCYMVVRTGERSFKEVRLQVPGLLRKLPSEYQTWPAGL